MPPPATIHSSILAPLNQAQAPSPPNPRAPQRHLFSRNTFPPGLQAVADSQFTLQQIHPSKTANFMTF